MGRDCTDLMGKTFGILKVIGRAKGTCSGAAWVCRCRCGRLKEYKGTQLKGGKAQSCGCQRGGRR